MHIVIAKVDQVFFDGEATSLTAPGSEGELTALGEHMPLVTTLRAGRVVVRADGLQNGQQEFLISGGIMEVRRDGATILL